MTDHRVVLTAVGPAGRHEVRLEWSGSGNVELCGHRHRTRKQAIKCGQTLVLRRVREEKRA